MHHDDFFETRQAPPLGPQVWACDCITGLEGCFKEVQVTNGGQCTYCNHYARKIVTLELENNKKARGKRYTSEKETAFVELRKNLVSIGDAAKRLGISYSTALKWNNYNGCGTKKKIKHIPDKEIPMSTQDRTIAGRPRNPKTVEILKLRQQGYTYGNIAELIKEAPSTVATICQREFKLGRYRK
jgi:hypothetical protein